MDPLQFALFFAALLVGYALVHLRMIRFEGHLQKLTGIKDLDDRLRSIDDRVKQMAESTAKVSLERVSAQLERLHEDLEDLREATTEVRQAVVKIPGMTAAAREKGGAGAPGNAGNESPATRIVALIETRLLQLGFRHIRLIGNLVGAQMADEIEVQVEAERNGMPYKGRVVMRNGSVHDVNVQSVAQAFP
jgi:hypothetical protein